MSNPIRDVPRGKCGVCPTRGITYMIQHIESWEEEHSESKIEGVQTQA